MTEFRPDELSFLTGELSGNSQPSAITAPSGGGKFDYHGNVLPWPGNTIICHINPDSQAHAALIDVQDALKSGEHAELFTFLPTSSLHMTVFQGISGSYSEGCDWPADVPTETDRNAVSDILLERLSSASLPTSHRIRPLGIFAGHSITVDGADAEQEALLRDTRKRLRTATGIEPANFDTYTFHITLAYLVRWLDDKEARAVMDLSSQLSETLIKAVPEITLGKLELCNFENMHHFEPLATLGNSVDN